MSRARRAWQVACLALASACGAGGSGPEDAGSDGSSDGSLDMGPLMSVLPADPSAPPFPAGEGSGTASCYDGDDDDLDGDIDCEDASCRSLGSCCVGDGDCTATGTGFPLVLDPTGCADGSAEACLGTQGVDVEAFGAPRIEGGALVAGGDLASHAGLFVGPTIDLATERVEIAIDVAAPTGCGATCLEGLTLAVARDAPGDVDPVVGLALAPALGEASLVAGGEPILRRADASAGRYVLVVRPDGSATASRDGVVLFDAKEAFVPNGSARVALYGRSRAPGGDAPLSVSHIAIDVGLADVPSAWGARTLVAVRDAGTPIDFAPDALSVASDDTTIWLALSHAGAITITTASTAAPDDFNVVATLEPGTEHDLAGLRAPALAIDGTGTRLYYLGDAASGVTSLLVASAATGTTTFVRAAIPITWMPSARSIALAPRADGVFALVARAGTSDRASTASFASYVLGGTATLALDPVRLSVEAFGAESLGATSLLNRGGAWQLFLDVRRGTRTGIALFASHEAVLWRTVGTDPVLVGVPGTPDALGARAPAVLPVSDEEVWLYYVGSDGARERVMRATRRSAERGSFPDG